MDSDEAGGAEPGTEGNDGYDDAWEEGARADEAGPAADAAADAEEDRHDHPDGDELDDSGQPGADEDRERQEPDAGDSRPAGSETTDDIWANATPAQRDALTALEERARRAENTLRSNNGRWSSAQQELNELRAKISAQPAPGGDAATNRTEDAAGGDTAADDEELQRVADEYGDIAGPLVKVIADLRNQVAVLSQDRTKRAELEQTQARLDEQESLAREEQALATDHPDWNDVVQGQAFADWVLKTPRTLEEQQELQAALNRNGGEKGIVDGAEASRIVSAFKRDAGLTAPGSSPLDERRDRQLAGSQHIPARRPAMEPRGKGSGTFDDEWDRAEAEDKRRQPARR